MKTQYTPLVTCLFMVVVTTSAQALEVHNLKAKTKNVDILAYTKSSGIVRMKRMKDGQIFDVKISIFDAAPQKKIIDAAPAAKAQLKAEVTVGKRRKDVPGSSYLKRQTISAKAVIENDSRDIDFADGKVTLYLVARQTNRYANKASDYGKIIAK